jgi:Ca2+-transporting ATPase
MSRLKTQPSGLTLKEAEARLERYGSNELLEKQKKRDLELFLDQFRSLLIWILIVAVAISAFLGEILDAIVISAIVIINAILGFVQIKKAEEAISALKKMAAPTVSVMREGQARTISSKDLVPGDIILLKAGDKVPADCRIMRQMNLKLDESVLTGESASVTKSELAIGLSGSKEDLPIFQRKNLVFAGTTVVYGRCEAVVVLTGMSTEFGKIAETLQTPEEETPLQKKIDALGRLLGILFVAVCLLVFLLGIASQLPAVQMFVTALALAVAAVPEGLLAAITIALAVGITRMAKQNAIVRRLTAVEGLGSVTAICSDKTGTLTVNEMTVRRVWTLDNEVEVTGEGYRPSGKFIAEGRSIDPKRLKDAMRVLKAGLLCNDALGGAGYVGDPTEIALLVSARKAGLKDLRASSERVGEIPFDSSRKMMSVLHETDDEDKTSVWTKGAVEEVLKRSAFVFRNGKITKMTEKEKRNILDVNRRYAERSYRILAFAMKRVSKSERLTESRLVFLGLQAMIDPPRPEAKGAIARCRMAGIKVVMITGDHKETAVAVAKELDILGGGAVLSGEDLDRLGDREFGRIVEDVSVYARVSPEHKVRITEALKGKGHVVAMTGDGVNDAPALRKADIGVAMGITGTDVTKEVADIVITDDDFSTIVSAVSEGRGIYDNIRKTIALLLSGNIGEVGVLLIAILAGLPLPLAAIQILWINLVTDGLPALAIAIDPISKDVMSRKPRPREESLTDRMRAYVFDAPVIMVAAVMLLFVFSLNNGKELVRAQTIVFTTVIVFELFLSLSCRSLEKPVGTGVLDNRYLILAIAASLILHASILYTPSLNDAFNVVPLTADEWLQIFAIGLICYAYLETAKAVASIASSARSLESPQPKGVAYNRH